MNFKHIRLSEALALLSSRTQQTMHVAAADDVYISINIPPMPWPKVLAALASAAGLTLHRHNDVWYLRKPKPIQSNTIAAHKPQKNPALWMVYHPQALTAAAFAKIIQPITTAVVLVGHQQVWLLTAVSQHQALRQLFEMLDTQPPTIIIQARIVLGRVDIVEALGNTLNANIRSGGVALSGANNSNTVLDLGISNPIAAITTAYSSANNLLALQISALQSTGTVKVLAQPHIKTQSGATARISTGTEIAYVVSTEADTNVTFKEAALALEVTPTLLANGRIHLMLQINQDTVGTVYNTVPSVDSNKLMTEVIVNNQETLSIGGVFQAMYISEDKKVPWFADIPLLGWLFHYSSERVQQAQLVVFLTASTDQ